MQKTGRWFHMKIVLWFPDSACICDCFCVFSCFRLSRGCWDQSSSWRICDKLQQMLIQRVSSHVPAPCIQLDGWIQGHNRVWCGCLSANGLSSAETLWLCWSLKCSNRAYLMVKLSPFVLICCWHLWPNERFTHLQFLKRLQCRQRWTCTIKVNNQTRYKFFRNTKWGCWCLVCI